MAKRLLFVCLLLVVSTSAFAGHLVRFNGKTPENFEAAVIAAGGTITSLHAEAGFAGVAGLTDESAAALQAATGAADVVADPGFEVRLGTPTDAEGFEPAPEAHATPSLASFYPRQWHLRRIGADQAWAAGRRGSSAVTVAILDSGISYTHADLAGLVDLSRSKSFVPADDALVASLFPGFHPITDLHYHGTHVAATVASNAHAAAGVTQKVKLIGVKVLGYNAGSWEAVVNGLHWAADQGADVANMSLGGDFPVAHNGRFMAFLQKAVNYANHKGMLVVVAAGNGNYDLDHNGNMYNAFCNTANVVCVSATGPTGTAGVNGPWVNEDARASYSNYGRSTINVAAPGGTPSGPVWAACSRTSLLVPVCRTGTFILGLQGTSMASPHVAGLAALIVEDIGPNKPAQVRARLQKYADDLGQVGTDPFYGKGRINVPATIGLQ